MSVVSIVEFVVSTVGIKVEGTIAKVVGFTVGRCLLRYLAIGIAIVIVAPDEFGAADFLE